MIRLFASHGPLLRYALGRLLLFRRAVGPDNDRVVSLVWFQRQLFVGLEIFLLQLLHFPSKHRRRLDGRINAIGLNRNDKMAAILEELRRIESNNTSLIRLSYISKHGVNHGNEHAIL